jgi:hypothetical protein
VTDSISEGRSAGKVICALGEASGVPGKGSTSSPRSAAVRLGIITAARGLGLRTVVTRTIVVAATPVASSAEEPAASRTSARRRRRWSPVADACRDRDIAHYF